MSFVDYRVKPGAVIRLETLDSMFIEKALLKRFSGNPEYRVPIQDFLSGLIHTASGEGTIFHLAVPTVCSKLFSVFKRFSDVLSIESLNTDRTDSGMGASFVVTPKGGYFWDALDTDAGSRILLVSDTPRKNPGPYTLYPLENTFELRLRSFLRDLSYLNPYVVLEEELLSSLLTIDALVSVSEVLTVLTRAFLKVQSGKKVFKAKRAVTSD